MGLWVVFGLAAGLLVLLIICRKVIGLFLDPATPAESPMQSEQQAILMRVNRLTQYIRALWFASSAVLLVIAGIWIYRGIVGFSNPSLQP